MAGRRPGSCKRLGDGIYRIRWNVEQGGGRVQKSKTLRGVSKAQAESELAKRLDPDAKLEPRRMTVNELLDCYFAEGRDPDEQRPKTWEDYKRVADGYIRPHLGRVRASSLRVGHIDSWLVDVGRSARTRRYSWSVLSGCFKWALRREWVALNPCTGAKLPKLERKPKRVLDAKETRAFLDAIRGARHEVYLLMLIATGMRPSEVRALRWGAVDLEARRPSVRVVKTVSTRRRDGQWDWGDPKTINSRRTVRLPELLVGALRAHRDRNGGGQGDLVFPSRAGAGEPLDHYDVVLRHFKPALRQARLDERTKLYELRHSFATALLERTGSIKAVQSALGHSSAAFTLDTYVHTTEQMEDDAVAAIDDYLAPDPDFVKNSGNLRLVSPN